MFKDFKDFCTAREPGEGFFGGAEGALRFLALSLLVVVLSAGWAIVSWLF